MRGPRSAVCRANTLPAALSLSPFPSVSDRFRFAFCVTAFDKGSVALCLLSEKLEHSYSEASAFLSWVLGLGAPTLV